VRKRGEGILDRRERSGEKDPRGKKRKTSSYSEDTLPPKGENFNRRILQRGEVPPRKRGLRERDDMTKQGQGSHLLFVGDAPISKGGGEGCQGEKPARISKEGKTLHLELSARRGKEDRVRGKVLRTGRLGVPQRNSLPPSEGAVSKEKGGEKRSARKDTKKPRKKKNGAFF